MYVNCNPPCLSKVLCALWSVNYIIVGVVSHCKINFVIQLKALYYFPSGKTCNDERLAAMSKDNIDNIQRFIPSCQSDGRYEPTQCHMYSGYCWYVCMHSLARNRSSKFCSFTVLQFYSL